MNWLYLDNFRGFHDTYIPLKDVNFLVGENSTGKTSVLSIMHTIIKSMFSLAPQQADLSGHGPSFGMTEDITQTTAEIRVGLISQDYQHPFLMLRFYTCKKAAPNLSKLKFLAAHTEATLFFNDNTLVNLINAPFSDTLSTNHNTMDIFKKWLTEVDNMQGAESYNYSETSAKIAELVLTFLSSVVDSLANSQMTWFAPIRSKPRRTYDSYKIDFDPEGEHTPYLVRKLLNQEPGAESFRKFIENFGRESNLFQSVVVKEYEKSVTAPFELKVVLNDRPLSISNVGYGIGQILPIVVEMFAKAKET